MIKSITSLIFSSAVIFSIYCSVAASCKNNVKQNLLNDFTSESNIETKFSDSIMTEANFEKGSIRLVSNNKATVLNTNVGVRVHRMDNYNELESFGNEAAAMLERVVNSPEFARLVVNSEYVNNKGFTSQEIYDRIMGAHETVGSRGVDKVIDLRLRTITPATHSQDWIDACNNITVGADGGGSGIISTCPNWISKREKEGNFSYLAGHYMHEYLHILGFSHPTDSTKLETVPYKIGYIVRDLGTNYGKPLQGIITNDQRFETVIDGKLRLLVLYKTSMRIARTEKLDMFKYIGKKIKIKVESFTDTDAYGAIILR
jgi:hypothetical protein